MVTIKELHAFKLNMKIYADESHQWAKYGKANAIDLSYLAEQTKARVSTARRAPLWIFDIDSTLLCLSNRFQHIFSDFLRFEYKAPVPAVYWAVANALSPETHRYGIGPALEPVFSQCGVEDAFAVANALAEEMFPFWYQGFFSERYLDKDFEYPDAAKFVTEMNKMGAHICYLTGRHAKTMTRGTRETLKGLGFPLNDQNSFLIMKNDIEESDVGYKHRYLDYLNRRYEVLGFVDNEPENIRAQMRINSSALPVWFHSISSDRIPLLTKVEEKHLCVLRSFNN